ncbi:MAG: septal ring lytic transglycosylase RlpA family protein [Deltaproteobacteria bacterium]|nr:septal ring lytic transglycosylase RlpA family protein [Deltaproteobacteria bacterium]
MVMQRAHIVAVVALIAVGCCRCPKTRCPADESGKVLHGKATYYADKYHGRTTASGEIHDKKKLTAAHRTLPFGTKVKVTNLANMKSVVVTINDRGPFGKKERIIDLSRAAAEKIGMIKAGVVDVTVEILD